jgi:anti-anti-sigma regulatory factor
VAGFEVKERLEAGVAVLGVSGDLDVAGAAALMASAVSVARGGVRSIVCDLGALEVPFCSHLLTVFPAMQHRIGTWPRRAVSLTGASPAVAQRLVKLGVNRFMSVHATMDAALAEVGQDEQAVHRGVRLAPLLSSPARARLCADTLIRLVPPEVKDVVRIVVSELTTNVVKHVQCPFTLRLASSPSGLLVAVTDISRQEPILRPVQPAATDGRGIQLVDALSQSWGVRLVHQEGKTVWARIATTAA